VQSPNLNQTIALKTNIYTSKEEKPSGIIFLFIQLIDKSKSNSVSDINIQTINVENRYA